MNDAIFRMSISEAIEVCQACRIYKGQCCSNEERKVVMPLISCIGEYTAYVKNLQSRREYDILLADESMFQFDKSKKETIVEGKKRKYDYFRYCFIQSPTKMVSFEEYCKDLDNDEVSGNEEFLREMYETDGDVVEDTFPLYLRYDVDYKGYLPNSHSYAHLHIGFKDGYRLPVSLILTPKAFVCMVLKLVYSDIWKDEVVSHSNVCERVYSALKSQCNKDKNPYWNRCEENDLYIK